MKFHVVLFFVFGLFGFVGELEGQGRPNTREGFFISFGFGAGSLGCPDCDGEREAGTIGYLSLGGTINDNILLGFESNAWVKEESGVTLTQSTGAAVVYFTSPNNGFFGKVGLGLSVLDLEVGGFGSESETGVGFIAGLGYDIRVGDNFSLTPFGNLVYGTFDDIDSESNVVQIGLGFTWH